MSYQNGAMYREYWVSCKRCGHEVCLAAPDYKKAAKQAREWSWRYRPGGWVCSDCAATRNNIDDNAGKST